MKTNKALSWFLAIYAEHKRKSLVQKAGESLALLIDRTSSISDDAIILVSCMRNEAFRIPFFLEYYRKVGVNHFIFIDNDSTDGLRELVQDDLDVSLYHTSGSYRESNFGMLWCNYILDKHCHKHWVICVDPDEFLVYPHVETRRLKALTDFLAEEKRDCMHTLTIDAYGRGKVGVTHLGPADNPFDICPYFDKDGYTQQEGWGGGCYVQGGARMRELFSKNPQQSPALNKIPLVLWRRSYYYRSSMHDMYPWKLNRAHNLGDVSVTGALFHFKFVSSFEAKVQEEAQRGQHYNAGFEYKMYDKSSEINFYRNGLSERFMGSDQLERLGLISAGNWF